MPRKGENIYKRKDGRWEGRYPKESENGFPQTGKWGYVYAKSYAACKQKRREAMNRQAVAKELQAAQTGARTLAQLVNAWLDLRAEEVKISTYHTYRALVERHILPDIGGLRLDQLGPDTIAQYLRYKRERGRLDGSGGLAANTVANLANILTSALKLAGAEQLLPKRAGVKSNGTKKEKPTEAFLLEEQRYIEQKIEACLPEHPQLLGLLLCLYSGIRVGELCALQWQNVSFCSSTILIAQTLQRIAVGRADGPKTALMLGSPKSAYSVRTIPLPNRVMDKLRRYHDALPEDRRKNEDFAFLQDSGKPFEPRLWEKWFRQILAASQGVRQLKFHALRHTFATRAIESGMDIKSVSEILGHSSVEITMKIYVHSFMAQKKVGMERLELYINDAVRPLSRQKIRQREESLQESSAM